VNSNYTDWTPSSLATFYNAQLADFATLFPLHRLGMPMRFADLDGTRIDVISYAVFAASSGTYAATYAP
jgi:hypothetical protein